MTLGELLPVRLGMLTRAPRSRHRAIDEIDRQKALRLGADMRIKALGVQLEDAEAIRAWTAQQLAAAEELVVKLQADVDDLTAERDQLAEDNAALRIRFGAQLAAEANANRVDVPPMRRIGADQDTTSIDVTSLWAAADAGLLPGSGPGRLTDSDAT